MDRERYLRDPSVAAFIEWARPLVAGERPLQHEWHSPKWGQWSCATLFDAYEAYEWRFSVTLPGEDRPRSGRTLPDTLAVLDHLRTRLRDSADLGDPGAFVEAAVAVVRWGQVRRNETRLRALGERALPVLSEASRLLDPGTASLSALSGVSDMNSGFSKIYSLMLDDFPIYDSRVACALGSLVRAHCDETGLSTVPELLAFGVPASRGSVSRDPSTGTLRFPTLWPAVRSRYARSNVMAAWLLKPLADVGPFAELPVGQRMIALQSALFMVGYAPWLRHEGMGG